MCASPVGKGSNRFALPPGLPVGRVVRWNGFWRAHGIRGIRRVAYMGAVCSGAHPVRHAARVRRFKQDDIASKNRCRPDPAIAISYLFNSKHGPMIAIGVVYGVAPRALGVGERLVHQCLEIQGSTRQAGGPPSSL